MDHFIAPDGNGGDWRYLLATASMVGSFAQPRIYRHRLISPPVNNHKPILQPFELAEGHGMVKHMRNAKSSFAQSDLIRLQYFQHVLYNSQTREGYELDSAAFQ